MRDKLAAASALIKAKEYHKARQLLQEIDHPQAQEWLKRLDQVAPEKKNPKDYHPYELG